MIKAKNNLINSFRVFSKNILLNFSRISFSSCWTEFVTKKRRRSRKMFFVVYLGIPSKFHCMLLLENTKYFFFLVQLSGSHCDMFFNGNVNGLFKTEFLWMLSCIAVALTTFLVYQIEKVLFIKKTSKKKFCKVETFWMSL